MTREEIIDLLKKDKVQRGQCFISDALDIAIRILERENYTIDKIKAEIKHNSEHFINDDGEDSLAIYEDDVIEILNKYTAREMKEE
ncbi:MAG: hypothetical protein LIR46_07755 [Bacteroidota bacterium]|nr:hypothetical protein [Bacteroidota bacterium]